MKALSEIKGMRNIPTSIVRKISGMPRTINSRKDYLQIYVLAKEKDRMAHELEMLEGKRDNILKNLTFIESKMVEYQKFVNNSMNVQCTLPSTTVSAPQTDDFQFQADDFQTEAGSQDKIELPYKENDVKSLINRTVKEKKEKTDFAKPSLFIRYDVNNKFS